jgi:uncharacterized membrane protein YedE/YeeE
MMLHKIFKNWTVVRAIYLIIGVVVIIQAITTKQWIGILLGGYFASMGLFAIGCAGGACYGTMQRSHQQTRQNGSLDQVEFEEVK